MANITSNSLFFGALCQKYLDIWKVKNNIVHDRIASQQKSYL